MNLPEVPAAELLGSQERAAELFAALVRALQNYRDEEAPEYGLLLADAHFRLPGNMSLGEFAIQRLGNFHLTKAQANELAEWALGSSSIVCQPSLSGEGSVYYVEELKDDTPTHREANQNELEELRHQLDIHKSLIRKIIQSGGDDDWRDEAFTPEERTAFHAIFADTPDEGTPGVS